MSSTTKPIREGTDRYFTPEWVTELIIPYLWDDLYLPVLEPACGDGNIVKVLQRYGYSNIACNDIVKPSEDSFIVTNDIEYTIGDFLEYTPPLVVDAPLAIITNPPYNKAFEFVKHAVSILPPYGEAWFLLRLDFLESKKRQEWLRTNTPDVFVLPRRPSFTGTGTDSCAYAWMCFGQLPQDRTEGVVKIL